MLPQPQVSESRSHARHLVRLKGRLQGTAIEVRNVSVGGLQLQVACTAPFFDLLRPKLTRSPLTLTLRAPDGAESLELTCEVVYVNEDDAEYLLGLKLLADAEGSCMTWQQWVERLEPR